MPGVTTSIRPATGRRKEVTVLIVDDHPLVREGLRTILEAQGDIRVMGEGGSAEEGITLARRLRPDVMLLDVRLPGRGGVDVCREIREVLPETKILMMSGMPETASLIQAAALGADGFLSKETSPDGIVDAVRQVAEGATVVDPASARTMFRNFRSQLAQAPRLGRLSNREREVLALLAEALTNREIAARLHLSEKTVRNHVSSVLRKLGLRHRTEAALFFAPLLGELS